MTPALLAGVAGPVLFVVTFLIDGATRPGYDPIRHPVSALALGARGWVQTGNFVVSGVLIAASAFGVHEATGSLWLAVPIAVFGLSLVASGVFPMDPMQGYPPGTPAGKPPTTSRRHQLHDWAGMLVFSALPVSAVVAALTLESITWVVYSIVTAVVFTTLFLRFGAAWEADDPRAGLLQRLTIVSGWSWLGLLSWHLSA